MEKGRLVRQYGVKGARPLVGVWGQSPIYLIYASTTSACCATEQNDGNPRG